MTELRHIFVPLDGSDFSRAAISHALALAAGEETTIELTSALDTASVVAGAGYAGNLAAGAPAYGSGTKMPAGAEVPAGAPDLIESARQSREKELKETAEAVQAGTTARVLWTLVEGEASDAIAAAAKSSGADLVIMSTHGRGGLKRVWLGSVADRLVRHITVPILLVRPEGGRPREVAVEEAPAMNRILVPLDGSPLAESALDPAVAVARRVLGSIVLLRVAETEALVDSPYMPTSEEEAQKHFDDLRRNSRDYLGSVAGRLRADGVEVAGIEVREGSVAAAILDVARDQADLVAMATHGRGGLKRWLLGSVSDKVLRGADLPVLLVRTESDNDSS